MSIAAEKIKEIRELSDIATVVGAYVVLKKSGRNLTGLCPFHQEKTPSFSVSAEKGLYYCFGCQAGGDVFEFTMAYHRIDFQQAVRLLATQCGMVIEAESPQQTQQMQQENNVARINQLAGQYFEQTLWDTTHTSAHKKVHHYIAQRKLPHALLKQQHIGFGGTHEQCMGFFKQHQITQEMLHQAGLLGIDSNRLLFADRLTFPIVDLKNRIVGFGGRRIDVTPTVDSPYAKYINSCENILFHKKKMLYGLYDAARAIRQEKRLIIVEGYMDVLAIKQIDVSCAVAALGTSFGPAHAALCKYLCDQAIVLLDGDSAGLRAARHTCMLLLAQGMQVHMGVLQDNHDPDSLLRAHGPDALRAVINNTKPAVAYFIDTAFADTTLSDANKASIALEMQPLLKHVQSGLERDLYTHRLAEKLGIPAVQLQKHLQPTHAPKPDISTAKNTTPRVGAASPDKHISIELNLLRELLLFPDLQQRYTDLTDYTLSPKVTDLLEELAHLAADHASKEAVITKHLDDMPVWAKRLSSIQPLAGLPPEDLQAKAKQTFSDILFFLKKRHIDAALHDVLDDLYAKEKQGEETKELMSRYKELQERRLHLMQQAKLTHQKLLRVI